MKISNEWYRTALVIGMYLSCFIVAISVFQIPKELNLNGEVPLRIILMLTAAFLVFGVTVYFAQEQAWKTIIKLCGYIFALISLFIAFYGLGEVIRYFGGSETHLSITFSSLIFFFGVAIALFIGKGINSKWLN